MKISIRADFKKYNKFIEESNIELLPFGTNIPDTREIIDSFDCAFSGDEWNLSYTIKGQVLTINGCKDLEQANEVKDFIETDYEDVKLPITVEIIKK